MTAEVKELLAKLRAADLAVFRDLDESLEPADRALLARKPNGHAYNCACHECED